MTGGALPARTRSTRIEGMGHMVEAAVRLLQERKPDEITVREIAAESGHHHRFVQAWFGGKTGLFRAAFDQMIESTAANVRAPFAAQAGLAESARVLAGLMSWLVAADPESLSDRERLPIVERLIEMYRTTFGFDDELARLMALRVLGVAISALLYGGPLGIRPDDVPAFAALEMELATLLATARSTAAGE